MAGNAAVSSLFTGSALTVQRDIDEVTALSAVDALPAPVLAGNDSVPLATEDERRHFLRAGQEWFGTYEATLDHFRHIEVWDVPGRPLLHRAAKTRLEAAVSSLGSPAPSSTVAFSFRHRFTADTRYTPASMHTLGYAIDYDAVNLPRIGLSETAELLRLGSGGPSNAQLGEYGARRTLIKATGGATAAGQPLPAGSDQLFDQIRSESQRLAAASSSFQASLGDSRDRFLDVRTRYFEAATPEARAAILTEIPELIRPWTDAITTEEQRIRTAATSAGLDPAALASGAQLTKRIMKIQQAVRAATADLRTTHQSDPRPGSPLWRRLAQWEQQVGRTGSGSFASRVSGLAEDAQRTTEMLRPLVGARELLERLASLRAKLTQPAFLFGTKRAGRHGGRPSTAVVADTPSTAQLLEHGFFNVGPAQAGNGRVNADFLVALARHGFELGMAWSGESTDSMHMELVAARGA